MSEHQDKHYKIQIREANQHMHKMAVTVFVLSLIEKTMSKTPAKYNFIEVLPQTF